MKKIIILMACIIFLIPNASANVIYQENSNAQSCDGSWHASFPCANTYDGNYDNVGICAGSPCDAQVYENYTKESTAFKAKWQYKTNNVGSTNPHYYNNTLASDCFSESPLQFKINTTYTGSTMVTYYYCYNGTAYKSIGSYSSSNPAEDAIYWGTPFEVQIQSPENKTYLSNTLSLNWSATTNVSSASYSIDNGANVSITGNGTINITSYGDHNIIVYVTDVYPTTNSTTLNFQTTEGIINLNVYDEEAPTTPILSNLTITNGTTTLNYYNVSSQPIYMEDVTGTLTITANDYAGLYSQRQISATMETGQNKTENIYLLLDSAGFQIDLNVYDSLSTGISGALVNISRQSGYTYNYVTECTTDSAGYCFVTLNDTATYKFVVSKASYVTKTSYITPTLTANSFTLQTPPPTINFTSELGGVTMLLTPQITSLKTSDAQPFNFTITSNETLTSWGMQILWQNYTGTTLFTSTQSTATGGSVNATINTTLYNGTVVVRTFLQRDGYALRSYYTNYSIHTITPYNHSLYNLIPDVQANYGGTFSNLFITLALLLFIVFASALFGLGTEVSGALLFVGLGYLSFFGLIPFNLFLLAMILFMSYVLWKG